MIVVDASVLAPALVDDNPAGNEARERLTEEELSAPQLIYLEIASMLRVSVHTGNVDDHRANRAMKNLRSLPLQTFGHRLLSERVWELRHNVTPYDASYVALAELLDVTLLTGDSRLANAPGPSCRFEVLDGTAA